MPKELLIDSHVLLWILDNKPLGSETRKMIAEAPKVFVSAASLWELRIKAGLGKLLLPEQFEAAVLEAGFLELPIYFHHSGGLSKLATPHKDPFDRLLIAIARVEDLLLVTADPQLLGLPNTANARL